MIAYLDTSAIVPLLIRESDSDSCRRLCDSAHSVVSCRLQVVEAPAALAHARRMGRIHESAAASIAADGAAAGDRQLLIAWDRLGSAAYNTRADPLA